MSRSIHCLSWCALLFVASNLFAQASFQGLGDLPGGRFNSFATAISDDGLIVVGGSESDKGPETFDEAFIWTASDGMVGLDDLQGGIFASRAYGVSGDGSTVVGFGHNESTPESTRKSFRWTALGGMISLNDFPQTGVLFNNDSEAFGVSQDGSVVVGWGRSESGIEAFRWTETGTIGLGDLPGDIFHSKAKAVTPDGSVVVGSSNSGFEEAFRWTQSEGMQGLGGLPNAKKSSAANAVSSDGSVIIGWAENGITGNQGAFRWTVTGGMIGLGDLPGGSDSTEALALSADGSVIVGTGHIFGRGHLAFIWDTVNGMQLLQDVLTENLGLDLTGWKLFRASAISADGLTIVGSGFNPNGDVEAWVATIPEPCTLCVLAIGGLVLRLRNQLVMKGK